MDSTVMIVWAAIAGMSLGWAVVCSICLQAMISEQASSSSIFRMALVVVAELTLAGLACAFVGQQFCQ